MSPSPSEPSLAGLLMQRMERLRTSVRRAALVRGVSVVLAAVVGLLLLWIGLDWTLHLDGTPTRWLALIGGLGTIAWLITRFIVRPAKTELRDVDLALLVERRHPVVTGDLASAIEFSARPAAAGPLTDLERDLIARTVEKFSQVGRDGGWGLIDLPALARTLALATAAVLAFLTVAWLAPRTAATALARLGLPWQVREWPRRQTLLFLDADLRPIPSGQNWRVAEGEALTLYVADQNDDLPPRVMLEIRQPDGVVDQQDLRQATLRDSSGESRQVAVLSLTPARGPIELKARGGDDDRLPPLRVDVAPPPTIERFEITLTPPAYSRKPAETVSGSVGHVQGLVGTEVTIQAFANAPLSSAILHRGQNHEELPLADDRRKVQTTFSIANGERTSYWFDLTDEHGLKHANPPRYEIRGIVDREPAIRIVEPTVDLRVQPEAEIPFVLEANDDWGLKRVELVVAIPGSAVAEEIRLLQDFADPARESRVESLLKIRELNAGPGTEFSVRGQAVDWFDLNGKGGHVARSAPRRIQIVSIEEKRQELAARQAGVAESLERARTVQGQVRQQVKELQIQWEKTRELRPEDRAVLSRTELSQKEVRDSLLDPSRGAQGQVAELLRERRWNRLEEPAGSSQLDRIERDLSQLAQESLPAVDATFDELRRGVEDRPNGAPRTGEQLKQALATQQNVLETLENLLGDLQEWRKQEDVRRRVGELVASQQTLSDETKTLGRQTISKAVSNLSPQTQADLARLVERQTRLADELNAVQGALQGESRESGTTDPESVRQAAEALSTADAAGKLQRAAGLMQENRLQQAGELQDEVLETLKKLDRTLGGDADGSEETLVKRLEEARREAAGLREQQAELRREVQGLSPQTGDPMQKEELQTLQKRQDDLQQRASAFAQRLRKRDLRQPAASARRGAERMEQADDALEQENVPEALQQQEEALQDLEQAERELGAMEQQARAQGAVRELAEFGRLAGQLADRQESLREETVRLEAIRKEQGKFSRGQLRTLQQTREAEETLARDIENLAKQLHTWPVLELGAEAARKGADEAARRLAERLPDLETQTRQSEAVQNLRLLAQSLASAPEENAAASPDKEPGEKSQESSGAPSVEAAALLAELKLLKTMQESLLEQTTRLLATKGTPPSEGELTELKELASRQQKLAELAETLMKTATGASPEK